ncbi:MAG: XrtN system VIT domain-containing protein [Flavobacteriales bacterium]|nr:XrtN system VIT domain-containing protein [Flavobacteriales bacterium]
MKTSILKDKGFVIGLILIPISFALHLFLNIRNEYSSSAFVENDGIFYINYIIAIAYFIGTLFLSIIRNWFKFSKYNYQKFILALILFSISCFTINIPFAVFSKFGTWVNIYLVAMHLALFTLCFNSLLPKQVKIVNFFVLGLGSVMCLYFSIYLSPLLPIAFVGAIFLGLSLHLLVPAIMLTTIVVQFIKRAENLFERLAFYSGLALPLIVIIFYTAQWSNTKKLIHKTQATIVTRPDNTLPEWVLMSQELGDDFFTERILKGDLVYETNMFNDMGFFGGNGNSLSETKEHDPLVVIGSEIMGSINLSRENRIKILESKFDLRHQTKRKLWSGEHLTTSSVISNIQIFPDYRLAYTEKIIRIKNNYPQHSWNRQEEALYTFHLPEGSVATSLSLWIDGKEEKSRLTTKSKADSAYTTIVGVERRDPSILHWQEGNTITVYVFPCTQKEERMFKIGITTPLKLDGENLVLQNIYFEGPDASNALETTILEYKTDNAVVAHLPSNFKEILPNKYQYDGNYQAYWEASCSATKLSEISFSFNGKSYHLTEAIRNTISKQFNTIYLDINKSWSENEFNTVWNEIKDKDVYVFHDKLYLLNNENKDKFYDILSDLNFSLFPLNKIKNSYNSLLISKSPAVSPMLKDLNDSKFVANLKGFLEKRESKINLYSLSDEISPYLKTLKEFQVFNYLDGDVSYLTQLLKKDIFINEYQNENTVQLGIANTQIIRDSTTLKSDAPDHLLRLFAYNKIMKDCGRNYFTTGNFIEEKLIDIANEAYIVSPISSLIVLETLKDYERFDIDENKNSLKNASTQNSGAVPEPHEWALIIILSLTLMFLYYKRKTNKSMLM